MKAIRLTVNDTVEVNFIVDHLLDESEERASAAHLQTLLADDRSYLLAVVGEGEVIGFALAYRFPSLYATEDMAYLYDIEVMAEHRRKGIGRMLIENLKTMLEADGVGELWLGTGKDNVAGQALFSKTGGKRSDELFHDFTYELS